MSADKIFSFTSEKLAFKAIDENGEKKYYVEGYATSGDLDLVDDIVTKDCMLDMMAQFDERVIKLDFEHEAYRGKSGIESEINKTKIPLGKSIEKELDSHGIKVKWMLNPTWKKFDEKGNITMTFKDLWSNVENGFYDAFSIAYIPKRTATKNHNGTDARLLDNIGLMNVALTGNPINPGASMTAVMAKSLDWMKEKEGNNLQRTPDETPGMKGKDKGDTMTDETNDKPDEPKKPEEKKDETKAQEPEQTSEPDKELIKVKSRLDALETALKAKDDEIAELKGIVNKAQVKSLGATDKSAEATKAATETKDAKTAFKGPIDLI